MQLKWSLVAGVGLFMSLAGNAADVHVRPSDFDETGVWRVEGKFLVAEKKGDDAEATAATPGAGSCVCWCRVLAGSKCSVDVGGTTFALAPEGVAGAFVWAKLGSVMLPGGYTAVVLRQDADGVRSAVEEVFLTMDSAWRPPAESPAATAAKPASATDVEVVAPGERKAPFQTKGKYEDFQLHAEWWTPSFAHDGAHTGAAHNNGKILLGGYGEILICDSSRLDPQEFPHKDSFAADFVTGAFSGENAPLANAVGDWNEWNTMDVIFRAPRWEGTNLVTQGEATVFVNGIVVQDRWAPQGGRNWIYRADRLQKRRPPDNKASVGFEGVKFRNVWVRGI